MGLLTERRDVNGPVVYGFLRLVMASVARQQALAASLAEYCRQHELLLSGVFTEHTARPGWSSAAFTGLMDVLAVPGTYGVVLPAACHLGPKSTAAERQRRIDATGARMLAVRGATVAIDLARPCPHRTSDIGMKGAGPARCARCTSRARR